MLTLFKVKDSNSDPVKGAVPKDTSLTSPIVIDFIPVFWNAYLPTDVTESGNEDIVTLGQLANALLPMVVNPLGKEVTSRRGILWNALAPIVSTESGIV
jgi:hypothetical protein